MDEETPIPAGGSKPVAGDAVLDEVTEGPRGFYATAGTNTETFAELYDKALSAGDGGLSWHQRAEVIRAAKKAFGPFRKWLEVQTKSSLLYGRRLDFIHDTLGFIAHGKRRISVHNWPDLLEEMPSFRKDLVRQDLMNQFAVYPLNINSTAEIIADWCAQPKGFDDMLCTLNILFGSPRSRPPMLAAY